MAICFGLALAEAESASRPLIFQYVSPYQENGTVYSSVEALSPEQMTMASGESALFDGITLIIPWSILEPTQGKIDFRILDAPLAYWDAKGKKVLLNVAPVTFPTRLGHAWGGKLDDGAPAWASAQCETRVVDVRTLEPHEERTAPFAMPLPWDPKFQSAYFDFISRLGQKYDGDPRLAAVRIGTGMEGEEQYLLPGVGFTNRKWSAYVQGAINAYADAFKKSELECDLSWAGVAWLGTQTGRLAEYNAGGADQADVENTLALMKRRHVVFGNNGWDSQDRAARAKWTAIDSLMTGFREAGFPVALESGSFQSPTMWDTDRSLAIAQRYRPVRINFLGTTIAIVNSVQGIHDARDNVALEGYRRSVRARGGDPDALAQKIYRMVLSLREIDSSAGTVPKQ